MYAMMMMMITIILYRRAYNVAFRVSGRFPGKLWRRSTTTAAGDDGGGGRVMCLHGFQDNCASFDRLVPLLDAGNTYMCLDLPNHGRSSGTPAGARWTLEFYAVAVERAARHARWDRPFACLGHSMGGQVLKLYAALYPERVRGLVMLDSAGPVAVDPDEVVPCARRAADQQLRLEDRATTSAPQPVLTREQALDRIQRRTYSRLSRRSAEMLLPRYVRPGPAAGQYLLANDVRLSVPYSEWFSAEQHRHVVDNVRCPVLVVRAADSDAYFDGIYSPFVRMYEARPNFRTVRVPGDHDVHMDHPDRVAPVVDAFLRDAAASPGKL